MSALEQLMTLAETAQHLRVSKATVIRLVKAGKLRTVRLGLSAKADRVHPDDLAAFVNENRRERKCRSTTVKTAASGKLSSTTPAKSIVDLLGAGPKLKLVRSKPSSGASCSKPDSAKSPTGPSTKQSSAG